MSEGLGRGDIPALVGFVGTVGVDDDEAVLAGEGGVLAACVGCCGSAVAPVGVYEDGGFGGEDVGYEDVEADVCGVCTEG